MLDSLIRVSRRAVYGHYASIRDPRSSVRAGRIARRAITPPEGPRSQRLCPAAQTDAGLPVGECAEAEPLRSSLAPYASPSTISRTV